MKSSSRRACLWLSLLVGASIAHPLAALALPLTLEDAIARALQTNAALLASAKTLDYGRASVERSEAWVPDNPFLSAGLLQQSTTGFGPNYGLAISQEFEVANQRSKRIAVAEANLRSAEWQQKSAERNLRATIQLSFAEALLADDRVTLAERGHDAIAELVRAKRVLSGLSAEGATIDRNYMLIQEVRARRDLRAAQVQRADAYDALRYQIGLPQSEPLELSGDVVRTVRPVPTETDLLDLALRNRADLMALRQEAEGAEEGVPLVRRQGIPNVTLSAEISRFVGDTFAGGSVSLPLPILRSNDPALMEAVADQERLQLEVTALERSIETEVRDARRTCVAAGEDLDLLQKDIAPLVRENLDLQRSRLESGEVGRSELIGTVAESQFAERELIDAVQLYNHTLIELERVVGGELW